MLNVEIVRVRKTRTYRVFFPYDESLKDKIKALEYEKRKWNGDVKAWEMDALTLMALIVSYKGNHDTIFFNFGGDEKKAEYLEFYKKELDREKDVEKILKESDERNIKAKEYKKYLEESKDEINLDLYMKDDFILYPHQKISIKFIEFTKKAYLALSPGLGKTICSIIAVEMNENIKKVFVITPNSLKFNFYNEVCKFTNSKAHILGLKNNKYTVSESKYVIVNYDYFNRANFNKKEKVDKHIQNIDAIILDEAHYIKNPKSNTTKNILKTFIDIPIKTLLSGTPLMNKTEELYTQFRFLDPIQFSSKQKFLEYYCGMKYDLMYGWVTVGEPKYEELYDKLNCYMYRKRKEDVFKDFPKKMHMIIELEMSPEERKEYQNIEDGVREEIATGEKIITNELAIVILGRLRQYTAKLKVKHIKDIVDNLLLQNEKVVITDPYRETLSLFKEQYPEESELHTGLVDLNERNDIVKRFQTSDLKIFLGSENTTKEGLTLTASCYMFQITQSFVPAIVEQLGDRINRIGQTKPCTIYFPIFKNTIDEIVWRVVEGKKNIISKIIDGEEYKKSYNSTKIGEIVRAFFGK